MQIILFIIIIIISYISYVQLIRLSLKQLPKHTLRKQWGVWTPVCPLFLYCTPHDDGQQPLQ